MAKFNPYTLQMQITRMFESGQSFFAIEKVNDWLRERKQDPKDYDIIFHRQSPIPETNLSFNIYIELKRKDGQEVDPWLQEEINRHQ